jgi:hypothetical protein
MFHSFPGMAWQAWEVSAGYAKIIHRDKPKLINLLFFGDIVLFDCLYWRLVEKIV